MKIEQEITLQSGWSTYLVFTPLMVLETRQLRTFVPIWGTLFRNSGWK